MPTERIDIVVNERGSRRVRRNIGQIGTSATAAEGAVKLLRRSLGMLAGALAIGSVVRTLANFSQEMSTVKAISKATGKEFDELRAKARALGATTRFSASEAADGMVFLARAGFNANQVLSSISGTLELAQAGALELAQAADIASNVLQGFRLNVSETSRVVDVLAAAANSTNTNVSQLGDAMKFVAPVAAGLGVSLEEATAAAGALSNAGLQASLAGTGLRRVLSELESPSTKTIKIFKQMGVEADQVRISQVGLTAALERLEEAGINTGLALEIFGDRGGPAFEVLASSIPDVKRLTKELRNADGEARRIAVTMDENLNGALFEVKSAFEAVILAIGDLGIGDALTNAFRNLADILRFVAKNIDDVAAAAGILTGAFVAMRLPMVIGLFRALAVAIAANPLTILVTTVVVATAAITVFRDQIKLTEDGTVTLGDAMAAASDEIGGALTDAVNSLGGSFKNFGDIVGTMVTEFSRGLYFLLAVTNGVIRAMITVFNDFPRALRAVAVSAWNGFLSITETALNAFIEAINSALTFLGIETKALKLFDLGALWTSGETAGDTLGRAFQEGFDAVTEKTLAQSAKRRAAEAAAALAPKEMTPSTEAAKAKTHRPLGPRNTAFATVLAQLKAQGELLRLNNKERSIQSDLLDAEDQLKRKLTKTETRELVAVAKNNYELGQQHKILQKLRGPQESYEEGLQALQTLLKQGAINSGEFAQETRELRLELLRTSTDALSGFERGLLRVEDEFRNLSDLASNTVVNAFRSAEDALVKFVKTGKLDFKSLVDSILEDLIRLQIRASITNPLMNFLGGIFGGGTTASAPAATAPAAITSTGTVAVGATGGLLRGGGSGTSDNIPALLSNGEFVTNAASTSQFLPLLTAINNFSGGGGGGGNSSGVVVQLIDQRGAGAPPIEQRSGGRSGTGQRVIQMIIRDTVRRQITSGEQDGAMNQRFGLTPQLRGR